MATRLGAAIGHQCRRALCGRARRCVALHKRHDGGRAAVLSVEAILKEKDRTMKTILQVEDDENDVFLLQHAMKRAGVSNPVQVATDGQQAIDYLQGAGKFADRMKYPFPCLVLLDLKLPYVMG